MAAALALHPDSPTGELSATPGSAVLPLPAAKARSSPPTAAKKKHTACLSCRLRKTACMQREGEPCKACEEKRIRCVTNLDQKLVRSGRRIEQAKARFGDAFGEGSKALQRAPPFSLSSESPDCRLGDVEFEREFAVHLFDVFATLPQAFFPLLRRPGFGQPALIQLFKHVGRELNELPSEEEVLALTVLAFASRSSSHPLLIGNSRSTRVGDVDLRACGRVRQNACMKLREKALSLASERGTVLITSRENAATCYLLDLLEARDTESSHQGRPFRAAFANHVRSLVVQDPITKDAPGWPALLLREALAAIADGNSPFFNDTDDLLLRDTFPPSMEDALRILEREDADRPKWSGDLDIDSLCAELRGVLDVVTFHFARLARVCAERITGSVAQRFPLDLHFLISLPERLDTLLDLLHRFVQRSSSFLACPTVATASARLPTLEDAATKMNASTVTARLGVALAQTALYSTHILYPSLVLPIYLALVARSPGEVPPRLVDDFADRGLHAIRLVAMFFAEPPSLPFLTGSPVGPLREWVAVLLDARTVEEGGKGITREEKIRDLRGLASGLKQRGYSWPGNDDLVSLLEQHIAQLEAASAASTSVSSVPPFHLAPVAPSFPLTSRDNHAFSCYPPPPACPPAPILLQPPAYATTRTTPVLYSHYPQAVPEYPSFPTTFPGRLNIPPPASYDSLHPPSATSASSDGLSAFSAPEEMYCATRTESKEWAEEGVEELLKEYEDAAQAPASV